MTKKITRPVSILLTILMISGVFTAVPFTVSAATSGTVGDFRWTMDDDGNMTVTGSGAIPSDHQGAFYENADVKSMVFDKNCRITEINERAIAYCKNLSNIVINSAVPIDLDHNAIWYNLQTQVNPISITINAPQVNVVGEAPIFAYENQLYITINTDEFNILHVFNSYDVSQKTMRAIGQYSPSSVIAYPENTYVYKIKGARFEGDNEDKVEEYNGRAQQLVQDYGDYPDMFESELSSLIAAAIEDGCTPVDYFEGKQILTEEMIPDVFGGAQTARSGSYTYRYELISTDEDLIDGAEYLIASSGEAGTAYLLERINPYIGKMEVAVQQGDPVYIDNTEDIIANDINKFTLQECS